MPRETLTAAVVFLLFGGVNSFRFHYSALQRDTAESSTNQSEVPYSITMKPLGITPVDFEWMTRDFTYQARTPTIWGWIKRTLFGGRRIFTDLKDELVTGHACNANGARSHTYYAASMCYWIPEIQNTPGEHNAGAQGPGLKWVKTQPGQQLCNAFSGAGRCMKCAVCHNNGRNPDGSVEATPFEEDVIGLPADCLKETQIEALCHQQFDGNHIGLVDNKRNCERMEQAYNTAKENLDNSLALQAQLNHRINTEIPNEIRQLEQEIARLNGVKQGQETSVNNARGHGHAQCLPWSGEFWFRMLLDFRFSGEQVLQAWPSPSFRCDSPSRPWCNVHKDWDCRRRLDEYERKLREYEECRRCREAKSQLSSAVDALRRTEQQISQTEALIVQKKNNELATARQQLASAEAAEPGLREILRLAGEEWLPDRDRCYAVYDEYRDELHKWMRAHVPTFYNVSCEKACLESSLADAGCGVMEGVAHGEIWRKDNTDANAGLELVCAPPFASFVKTPVKYGAVAETEIEMCQRIFQNAGQRPRRPQAIVKKGMLWKRERLWRRWRTRYFILESGDRVRSAVMRYWDKVPSEDGAVERGNEAIILWDARAVVAEPGTTYGWRNGEQCFRLQHFYRDFRLCTEAVADAVQQRDDWVSLIAPSITFPANYR